MSLLSAIRLVELEIKGLTPEYLGHPFVEAPRSRPIEELPASNEQRQFTVRPGAITRISDFDGESHMVSVELEIKVRYRALAGSDEADRDVYLMAAIDAHQITRAMLRCDVPSTWAGTISDVVFVSDIGNVPVESDPSSFIRELHYELTAFEGA
jgi:hypothetical protein